MHTRLYVPCQVTLFTWACEHEHECDSVFEKYFKLLKFAIARTKNANAELILIVGAEGILQDFVTENNIVI